VSASLRLPRGGSLLDRIVVAGSGNVSGDALNLREYAIDMDLRSLGIAPIWVSDFAEIPVLLDQIRAM
jgi:hypothetical protein